MSFTCPTCGRQNYETFNTCRCGYSFTNESALMQPRETVNLAIQTDDPFFTNEEDIMEQRETDIEEIKVKVSENPVDSNGEEIVIKEIDSWMFTFSQLDECIYLGTPALQSFRLKLTKDDLEKLLEFVYEKTGEEKTTRKRRLLIGEIPDLIDKVDRMVEEKKSKVAIKFAGDELQEIADLINMKLKE